MPPKRNKNPPVKKAPVATNYSDSDDDFQIAARERASNPNTVVPNEEIKREEYSYQNDEDQGHRPRLAVNSWNIPMMLKNQTYMGLGMSNTGNSFSKLSLSNRVQIDFPRDETTSQKEVGLAPPPGFEHLQESTNKADDLSDAWDALNDWAIAIDLKDFEKLETEEFYKSEFPVEYRYLLQMDPINEDNIRKHPELYDLISRKHTSAEKIIEKEIAIVCLYWAQSILECKKPLLEGASISRIESKILVSKINPNQRIRQIIFKCQYPKEDRRNEEHQDRVLKSGMVVFFESKTLDRVMARVRDTTDDQCTLVIRCGIEQGKNYDHIQNKKVVNVWEIPQEFVPTAMIASIQGMRRGVLKNLIIPQPEFNESHHEYSIRKHQNLEEFIKFYGLSPKLTDPQREALFAIAFKEHAKCPFVLWGPPGTGKTFTISQIVQCILMMNASNRILICTPSNMAADQVARMLKNCFCGVMDESNVLRLRSPGNDYEGRDREFDAIIACDDELKTYIIPRELEEYRVVICTLGCSAHLAKRDNMKGFFSHIMIDESGQASEAELWIPLGRLATEDTSVILCGDPKQLGPVITLDVGKGLQSQFTSPLVRYMEMEDYKMDSRLCVQLVDCFRCPPWLTAVVSIIFYDRKLKPMLEEHEGWPRPVFEKHRMEHWDLSHLEMEKEFPILFVSVNGREEQQPRGFSYANRIEADIVIEYANLFIQKGIPPDEIGIISPYRWQTKIIGDKMAQHPNARSLQKITIDSVERFQGSERRVILMTATRTDELGFMADNLRVNTSITRTKEMLIVIGSQSTLVKHRAWNQFIKECNTHKAVKKWDPLVDPTF